MPFFLSLMIFEMEPATKAAMIKKTTISPNMVVLPPLRPQIIFLLSYESGKQWLRSSERPR